MWEVFREIKALVPCARRKKPLVPAAGLVTAHSSPVSAGRLLSTDQALVVCNWDAASTTKLLDAPGQRRTTLAPSAYQPAYRLSVSSLGLREVDPVARDSKPPTRSSG